MDCGWGSTIVPLVARNDNSPFILRPGKDVRIIQCERQVERVANPDYVEQRGQVVIVESTQSRRWAIGSRNRANSRAISG